MKEAQSGLKISDFIDAIPQELRRPVEARSWWTLFRCLFTIGLLQVCLFKLPLIRAENFLWNAPLQLGLIFFTGLGLVGLFVLCHDCGHYSFSRHRRVNDVVGFLCSIPLLSSFFAWRAAHNFHHRHSQTRRVDPDWSEFLSTVDEYPLLPWNEKLAIRLGPGSPIGLLVGFWAGMIKRGFFSLLIPQMKMALNSALSLYCWNILSALASLSLIWIATDTLGFEKMLLMYGLPVVVAASTGAFLTFIQHSSPGSYVFDEGHFDPVLSHVHSMFNIRFPFWLEYLWLNINIHTPHHVLPSMPWYYLEAANVRLHEKFPSQINERQFSFVGLLNSWEATSLIKVKDGTYQISTTP